MNNWLLKNKNKNEADIFKSGQEKRNQTQTALEVTKGI